MVARLYTFDTGVVDQPIVAGQDGIDEIVDALAPTYADTGYGGVCVRAGSPANTADSRFRMLLGLTGNHSGSIVMRNNTAHGSATSSVNFFHITAADNTQIIQFRATPNNALSIRVNAVEHRVGSPNEIPVGAWFRVDWTLIGSTFSWLLFYDRDGTSADLSGTVDTSAVTQPAAKLMLGAQSTSTTIIKDWSFDTIRIKNYGSGFTTPYPSVVRNKWSGDGLPNGTLDTTSAGPGDTTFGFVSPNVFVDNSGGRPPRIRLAQVVGSNCYVSWGASRLINPVPQGAIRMYAEFTGWHASNAFALLTAVDAVGGTVWRVDISETDGNVRLRNATTLLAESAWTLPLNQRLRIETIFSTSEFGVYVYLGDSSVVLNELAVTSLAAPQFVGIRFGNNASSYAIPTKYFDDIVLTEDPFLVGPPVPEPPTPLFPVTVWDGAAELPISSVAVWDGTNEIPISSIDIAA